MGKEKEEKKYIHMKVSHHEAKEGAFSDVYYPLTKRQAKKKVNIKVFWLLFLLGFMGIGLLIEIVKAVLK